MEKPAAEAAARAVHAAEKTTKSKSYAKTKNSPHLPKKLSSFRKMG